MLLSFRAILLSSAAEWLRLLRDFIKESDETFAASKLKESCQARGGGVAIEEAITALEEGTKLELVSQRRLLSALDRRSSPVKVDRKMRK